jgi:hypothetical protein
LVPAEPPDAEGRFLTLLSASEHELLHRKPEKTLWAWFLAFREAAMATIERGRSITGAEILEMVKRALSRRRQLPPVRAPRRRPAPAERLLRLADSIAPNAPPFPPAFTARATEAG